MTKSTRSCTHTGLYRRLVLSNVASLPGVYKASTLATCIGLILFNATSARAQAVGAGQSPSDASSSDTLSEITVTAQRRAQTTQDIPYNITAISGSALAESGISNINDLTHVVPGLVTVDTGPAARGNNDNLSLRGLRTDSPGSGLGDYPNGAANSVSTYYDETPAFFPLALHDVERIEVLRGPQGTLYGSGAEGGTIRFILNKPDFDGLSGYLNTSGGLTENSDGHPNGSIDGALNVPLAEHLAIRISAGEDHLAGFINDVSLANFQNGVPVLRVPDDVYSGRETAPEQTATNSSDVWYARPALRWQASDSISVNAAYLHQFTKVEDSQSSNPNWPGGAIDFGSGSGITDPNSFNYYPAGGKYANTEPYLTPYHDAIDLVSTDVTVDFGLASFTSASSAYQNRSVTTEDITQNYFNAAGYTALPYYRYYPRALVRDVSPLQEKAVVEELRLVSTWSKPVDYVVGAYFNRQLDSFTSDSTMPGIRAFSNAIGQPGENPSYGDVVSIYSRKTAFTDRAIFGELTYHFTPAWQGTIGARQFWQYFTNSSTDILPFCGAPCSDNGIDPLGSSADVTNTSSIRKHIGKLNTSYDVSSSLKLYATFAEGFRRGGANGVSTGGFYASLPSYTTYKPDFAKSYEVGVKGAALDNKLRYTADVYWINLTQFQFEGFTGSIYPATFNGGTARSKGAELEVQAIVTERARVSLGYAYTNATITQGFQLSDLPIGALFTGTPPITIYNIASGTKLPGVPLNTLNMAGDYTLPLNGVSAGNTALRLHLDASYRSRANGYISPDSPFFWTVPSSVIANTRITYDSGGAWATDLFVNNISSNTAYSGATSVQSVPDPFASRNVSRPRTVGLALHYKFGKQPK